MIINLKNTVNTGPDLQLFPDNKVVNSIIPVRAGYGIPRYTLQKTGQKNLRLGDAVPKSYPIFYPIIHMNHYESIFSHIDCPILIHINPYFIPYKIIFIHIFQRFFFPKKAPFTRQFLCDALADLASLCHAVDEEQPGPEIGGSALNRRKVLLRRHGEIIQKATESG